MSDGWGECGRMEAVIHVEVPVILQDIYIYIYNCSSQGGSVLGSRLLVGR